MEKAERNNKKHKYSWGILQKRAIPLWK